MVLDFNTFVIIYLQNTKVNVKIKAVDWLVLIVILIASKKMLIISVMFICVLLIFFWLFLKIFLRTMCWLMHHTINCQLFLYKNQTTIEANRWCSSLFFFIILLFVNDEFLPFVRRKKTGWNRCSFEFVWQTLYECYYELMRPSWSWWHRHKFHYLERKQKIETNCFYVLLLLLF